MLRIIIFLLIFIFSFNKLFAGDIPIIVISAGKTYQSKGIVGSDVEVIDSKAISESNEFFLGELLSKNLNGMNYFQQGGTGTVSGIQLRGLPKRYSTVYVDGVKMSDPSTPQNDYYFNNLMTGSLDRVEILKGAQTSLYGSGALAGTVNIFSKKGRDGHNKNIGVSTGSWGTKNLNISFDGKQENYDYFLEFTHFSTDGQSAMIDNDEKDRYRNDSITANMGYDISDVLRVENYLRYSDYFLEYDEVDEDNLPDDNNTDDQEASYSGRLIIDNGNLKNTLFYNKTIIQRNVNNYSGAGRNNSNHDGKKDNFKGERNAINLLGEYNFNLDTKIVYGLDNEFDQVNMNTYYTGYNYKTEKERIYSQYVDLQLRPTEKLFSTIGFRLDTHQRAGTYETARATFAYKIDNNTKLRSAFGTGVRFGALDEYHYEESLLDKSGLKPEESKSFDIGIDKLFAKYNLDLSATLFYLEYDNHMSNWKGNTEGGKQDSYDPNTFLGGYVYENTNAKVKSQGFEIASNWNPKSDLNIKFGYAFTDSYAGDVCDDPQPATGVCLDEMILRVPKHSINSSINKKITKKIDASMLLKFASERRDVGNANNSYLDVILSDYTTVDLLGNYKISDNYNLNFSLTNLLDEDFQEAYQYRAPGRSFKFGLKKAF